MNSLSAFKSKEMVFGRNEFVMDANSFSDEQVLKILKPSTIRKMEKYGRSKNYKLVNNNIKIIKKIAGPWANPNKAYDSIAIKVTGLFLKPYKSVVRYLRRGGN